MLAACKPAPAESGTPPPYHDRYCQLDFGRGIPGEEAAYEYRLPDIQELPGGVEVTMYNSYPFKLAFVSPSLWIESVVVTQANGVQHLFDKEGVAGDIGYISQEGVSLLCVNPPPDSDINIEGATLEVIFGLSKNAQYWVLLYGADNNLKQRRSYHPFLD